MSSAFFRRPGEDSSDSESESSSGAEGPEVEEPSTKNSDNNSSAADLELATTESLPSNASFAVPETDTDGANQDSDQHKNALLTALLEHYYTTQAVPALNATGSGVRVTQDSPQVKTLARRVASDTIDALNQTGMNIAQPSEEQRSRQNSQYLSILDRFALKSMRDGALASAQSQLQLQDAGAQLALVKSSKGANSAQVAFGDEGLANVLLGTGRMSVSSPHSDMALTLAYPKQQSHYESSFQQLKLLGKGGFGKVYHAYSIFDRSEYAIKKIPLSPRLTMRYQQGGHQELESVLREVQALAQLDHSNVVRYHATWIEEPKAAPRPRPRFAHVAPTPRQRLLADRPHGSSPPRSAAVEVSEGVVFGFDSSRRGSVESPLNNGWSAHDAHDQSTSIRESQLFTDGFARESASTDSSLDDTVCVLHVQMSLYPMTLSQYLAPIPSTASSALSSPPRRHCFHLVPALRIILGIICGLQYIHTKGLVHRDIKPGNIFLSTSDHTIGLPALAQDGYYNVGSCSSCSVSAESIQDAFHVNPRIGDFGLVAELARSDINIDTPATDPSSPPPSPSKPVGTEYYRPPANTPSMVASDQVSGPRIDEKIDVYAMGVTLVELLWKCDTASERMQVLKDLQRGKLPRGFVTVLDTECAGYGLQPTAGIGEKMKECVKGMLERDSRGRWGLERVKERVLEVLHTVIGSDDSGKEAQRRIGRSMSKVRSLSGTEADSEPVSISTDVVETVD